MKDSDKDEIRRFAFNADVCQRLRAALVSYVSLPRPIHDAVDYANVVEVTA